MHRTFTALANSFRQHSKIKEVIHWTDPHTVDDRVIFEEFVDIDLLSGKSFCWSLELTISLDVLSIEAALTEGNGSEQETISEVPLRQFDDVEECARELVSVAKEVCAVIPAEVAGE